jgi:hypothetical protein
MATRCLIGYAEGGHDDETNPDVMVHNSVWAVYCHHDGYRDGVGKMLVAHWDDPVNIEELIEGGGISALGDSLESTRFYIRDMNRLERENRAQHFRDIEELRGTGMGNFGHVYVHTSDRGWLVADNASGGQWVPMEGTAPPLKMDEDKLAYVQRAFRAWVQHHGHTPAEIDNWLQGMLRRYVTDDRRRVASLARMIMARSNPDPSTTNESFDRMLRLAGVKREE